MQGPPCHCSIYRRHEVSQWRRPPSRAASRPCPGDRDRPWLAGRRPSAVSVSLRTLTGVRLVSSRVFLSSRNTSLSTRSGGRKRLRSPSCAPRNICQGDKLRRAFKVTAWPAHLLSFNHPGVSLKSKRNRERARSRRGVLGLRVPGYSSASLGPAGMSASHDAEVQTTTTTTATNCDKLLLLAVLLRDEIFLLV